MIVPFSEIHVAVFIGVTVIMGGGTAVLTGWAIAGTWRPAWQVVFACVGLGLSERFLVFALFDGPLLSVPGYLFDTVVIMIFGLASYRLANVTNMTRQYPWLYEKVGPWRIRAKE
jgi:hypothetical protein